MAHADQMRKHRGTPGAAGRNDAADPDNRLIYPLNRPGPLGTNDTRESDTQVADPNVVVCALLCYLGVPPAVWKDATEYLLRAISEQYRYAYDVKTAETEFRKFKKEFAGYSAIKVLSLILTFSADGKIAVLPVRVLGSRLAPRALLLQKRVQNYLIRMGAKLGAQQVAAHVLRKVVLVTELAFVGGCLGKCTIEAGVRALVELSKAIAEGTAAAFAVIEGIGKLVGDIGVAVFVWPVFTARATFDQSNWKLGGLPGDLARDLNATFGILWLTKVRHLTPDGILAFAGTPMTHAGIPKELLRDITNGLANKVPVSRGFATIFFPPEILKADEKRQRAATIQRIESMKVYEFIQYLVDSGYLTFKENPETMAARQLGLELVADEQH